MAGVGWFMAIVIGGIAGWLAEKFMKSEMGLLLNIVLGIVGAIVFNFLASLIFDFQAAGWFGSLIAGFIGACLLIWLVRLVKGRT